MLYDTEDLIRTMAGDDEDFYDMMIEDAEALGIL